MEKKNGLKCECVCVSVRKRESVCVCVCEEENALVSVCVRDWAWVSLFVCVDGTSWLRGWGLGGGEVEGVGQERWGGGAIGMECLCRYSLYGTHSYWISRYL